MSKAFKDKRIFWITPDFSNYFDVFRTPLPFFQELSASLADLPCTSYKYLIAYVPHLIHQADWMDKNDLLIMLESVFQREILLLDSMQQLSQTEFAPYIRTDCIYLCRDIEQTVSLHTYFDVIMQDALTLPNELADVDFKDKIVYGKSYLNTHLLPHMFLSKMQDRIQQFGMLAFNNTATQDTSDICLVVGKLPYDVEDALYDVLCDLMHNDRVACLISCNDEANCDYTYLVDRYEGESKYVMTYNTRSNSISQRSSNLIFRKFAALNKRTTTLILFGTFEFEEPELREQWQQRLKEYQSITLIEPWAWLSIYQNTSATQPSVTLNTKQINLKQPQLQTTCHIIDVLKSWNDMEVTFTVLPNVDDHPPSGDVTDEEDGRD